MTLEECYEETGGNFEDVLERLESRELIAKYLSRVPGDESCRRLTNAMERKERKEAYLAVHTLKGFALTLGLARLARAAGALCDVLADESGEDFPSEAETLYEALADEYRDTVRIIQKLL